MGLSENRMKSPFQHVDSQDQDEYIPQPPPPPAQPQDRLENSSHLEGDAVKEPEMRSSPFQPAPPDAPNTNPFGFNRDIHHGESGGGHVHSNPGPGSLDDNTGNMNMAPPLQKSMLNE